ncbi:MAG: PEP-CTERM sorting domain-containing protein [Opitutae bacterium]|nr:PEP-CTERM sorting domain-containing protein [Opitutae bacterium]
MKIAQIISPLVLVVAGSALSNAATLFDTTAGTTVSEISYSGHSDVDTGMTTGASTTVLYDELLEYAGGDALTGNPLTAGWHWGTGSLRPGSDAMKSDDVAFTADGTFTFHTRPAYYGEFVLSTVSVSGLLSDDDTLTDFSVSFDASDSVYFSTYYVASDNTTVTQLGSTQYGTSVSYSVDALSYTEGTLILLWGTDALDSTTHSDTTITVSNITSSYNNVPEPSMFGLLAGLGALGFVAARRRRNRKA